MINKYLKSLDQDEVTGIYEKAVKNAYEKVLIQEMVKNMRLTLDSKECDDDSQALILLRDLHNENMKLSKMACTDIYNLITVSPPNDTSFEALHKAVQKLGRKKTVDGIYAVYEWGDSGENFHVHIFLKQKDGHSYSKRDFRRNHGNTFKKLCDVTDSHFFDIKPKDDENKFQKTVDYLHGIKVNYKMDAVKNDILIREEREIDHIYNFGNDFLQIF